MNKLDRIVLWVFVLAVAVVVCAAVKVSPAGGSGVLSSASFDSSQFSVSAGGVVAIMQGASVSNLQVKAGSAAKGLAVDTGTGTNRINGNLLVTTTGNTYENPPFALTQNGAIYVQQFIESQADQFHSNWAAAFGNGDSMSGNGAQVGLFKYNGNNSAVQTIAAWDEQLALFDFANHGFVSDGTNFTNVAGAYYGNGSGLTNLAKAAFQIQTQSVAISLAATQLNFITPGATGSVANGQVTLGSTLPDVQIYTNTSTTATWTKPQGASVVRVICIGGGGGGGGGLGAATNAACNGGGGGAGAAIVERVYRASDLTATVTITVGGGGIGGGTNASGADGTNSTFGAYLTSYAGKGGHQGNTSGTALGGSGGGGSSGQGSAGGVGALGNGGAPGSSSGTAVGGSGAGGNAGDGGTAEFGGGAGGGVSGGSSAAAGLGGSSQYGAPGGGAGGGFSISPGAATAGAAGGAINSYTAGGGGTNGVAASASPGGSGTNGDSTKCGTGGGGGGGNRTGSAGSGGQGAYPGAGGGGGGSCVSGSTVGSGGAGGRGEIRVYSW